MKNPGKKILQFPKGTKITTITAVLDALIDCDDIGPGDWTSMVPLASGDIAVYVSQYRSKL